MESIETYRTKERIRTEPCDPVSLEREVRQRLDDKISGTHAGIWLLVPEHLRLGTWDLLTAWTGKTSGHVEPRLALQMINESALCVNGIRKRRSLSQQGFEIANGLPFLASDPAIHHMLAGQPVAGIEDLQIALGRIRQASGHFKGKILAIDPHRMRSTSKRQMRRKKGTSDPTPIKTFQIFFCIDTETHQPVAFTTATSGRTVTEATPGLLRISDQILNPQNCRPLVLADCEHFSASLMEFIHEKTPFSCLVPMTNTKTARENMRALDPEVFHPRWAGFATTTLPYHFVHSSIPFHQIVQRCGENPADWTFKGFISTHPGDEVELLTLHYPDRWHVEEFFNANQALGWNRAGTLNLNIRYAQMTFALFAQAALHQFRQRLGDPFDDWQASHLARDIFLGLDGDIRVNDDTIVVTFYNAPHTDRLKLHYEHLPRKLQAQGIDPHIPWLYNFKLDFRFR